MSERLTEERGSAGSLIRILFVFVVVFSLSIVPGVFSANFSLPSIPLVSANAATNQLWLPAGPAQTS